MDLPTELGIIAQLYWSARTQRDALALSLESANTQVEQAVEWLGEAGFDYKIKEIPGAFAEGDMNALEAVIWYHGKRDSDMYRTGVDSMQNCLVSMAGQAVAAEWIVRPKRAVPRLDPVPYAWVGELVDHSIFYVGEEDTEPENAVREGRDMHTAGTPGLGLTKEGFYLGLDISKSRVLLLRGPEWQASGTRAFTRDPTLTVYIPDIFNGGVKAERTILLEQRSGAGVQLHIGNVAVQERFGLSYDVLQRALEG